MSKSIARRFAQIALLWVSPAALLCSSVPAAAQSQIRSFDIPAQSLSSAILEFSRQADVVVVVPPEFAAGKRSAAIKGSIPVGAAIARLLKPTGLRAVPNEAGGYRVGPFADRHTNSSERATSLGGMSAASSTRGDETDEIIVTAQKREQRLKDVPMAVSAIGAQELRNRGALAIEDLQYSVPGIAITQWTPGQQRIQIRGISVFGGLPTVGVYLDDLPLNTELNDTGMDVRTMDLDRIEVLRGPQGTLYGQGALGGTVRYITKQPTLASFGGYLSGDVGTVKDGGVDANVEGALNIPIVTDHLAIRLAGQHQEYGGWIDNSTLGKKDVNSGSSSAIRGTILWRPVSELSLKLMVQHQKFEIGNLNLSDADRTTKTSTLEPASDRADVQNLVVSYDLGFANLLSSTGHISRSDYGRRDYSTLNAVLDLVGGLPAGSIATFDWDTRYHISVFNEEVRLSSKAGGPLTWTLGGMYRNSKVSTDQTGVVTPAILPFNPIDVRGTPTSNSESWAVFGEGTYAFNHSLEATLGLRYFEDDRRQDAYSSFFGGAASIDRNQATFHALSPRLNLLWRATDELNLYVSASKGFRSGGFNLTSTGPGVAPTYKPDTLWTYEAGAKLDVLDHKLTGGVAVYYNNWRNVQTLSLTGLGLQQTVNGSRISGWGFDGEISWRPIQGLALSASGSVNNLEYKSSTLDHLRGDPPDYTPHFTASASAEYSTKLSRSARGFIRADYQITDGYQVFLRDFMTSPVHADTQNYVNLRAGVEFNRWQLAAYVKNALDENGVTYPAYGSLHVPSRPEPRVIGLSGSITF